MKKVIKIIAIIFIILILNFASLINIVQAVEGEQITIYVKDDFKRVIRRNGIVIKTAYAVYNKDGREHPAFCLNRDLKGVGEHIATYDVTEQGKITDVELWRVIINGYPYKSIEELCVADEEEAYIATKQAVYCYIYNSNLAEYTAIGDAGIRVINAINMILQNAKNSTESFENNTVDIITTQEWQIDTNDINYISKQYELKSNINSSKFTINLENQLKGTQITDLENQEKNEFNSDEKFKILIPISSLENAGEFKIKIKTEMETKPIFFGKSPNETLQDYALTAFSYENVDSQMIQNYPQNETQIIIEKQDNETGENLKGAQFEIFNEKKQSIGKYETNQNGQISLNQILPGKYYIQEIQAPEGYEINSEIIQIEINLNEKNIIKIKNTKIEVPEQSIIEEPPEEVPIIEIPKLPVTGM